jgi:hypothetical protein
MFKESSTDSIRFQLDHEGCTVAVTIEEAKDLIEGEYVYDFDKAKLFRKRK